MALRSDLEQLDRCLWSNDTVSFRPLGTENDLVYAVCDCRLTDEQQAMVNPAWFSIGRAYLFREDNFPCIIDNRNGEPVGFISLTKWQASGDAYSWSYFIDSAHQQRGYGRAAAQLAVQILKAAAPEVPIKLAVEPANGRAQALYRSLGFQVLPETDGDDLVFGL